MAQLFEYLVMLGADSMGTDELEQLATSEDLMAEEMKKLCDCKKSYPIRVVGNPPAWNCRDCGRKYVP